MITHKYNALKVVSIRHNSNFFLIHLKSHLVTDHLRDVKSFHFLL